MTLDDRNACRFNENKRTGKLLLTNFDLSVRIFRVRTKRENDKSLFTYRPVKQIVNNR